MPETYQKQYKPAPYCPSTSFAGDEAPYLIAGENMWLRFGRFGQISAQGFTGNLDLSETIATKTLAGTISWASGSNIVTGAGTAFLSELHLGSFVLGDGGAGLTELLVVEKVVSDTSFICSRSVKANGSGKTGYVMPIIFPIGTDRGTAIRGNVLSFPKGHYLGVGDGTFRINGVALSSTLALSRTPRFALFDPVAGTYTQDDVGIVKMTVPITLTAVSRLTITGATAATPIEITSAGHGLTTGTKVPIAGIIGVPEANGTFIITSTGANTFTLNGTVGTGAYVSGGFVFPSQMRAGDYSVRVCRKSTTTLGFSQPTDVIAPVTLTANQSIKVTFNTAMVADMDAYDIYSSPFTDNSTSTVEARFMGPWFLLNGTDTSPNSTVSASDLIDGSHATGRETGTSYVLAFADAEIQTAQKVLSFDNFTPVEAEFVGMINGIPIYYSCQGKGNTTKTSTSPGAVAVPSKPSNPEAVFLNKAITTADNDIIIGAYNIKARVYALCQNSLQTLILTTLDAEPITFRSLWNAGFRNPYNFAAVKEYIYGFSTQKIVRSVAGGDDSAMEFEFASDIKDTVNNWETGHVLAGYDPKNRAVIFFYSAAERRSQSGTNYWVTIALPFLLDKQVWNPPIILRKANTDFVVSGVATIGERLTFLAGGRTSGGAISVGTYVFDGGDGETKDWYLAWAFSDDDNDLNPKTIKGETCIARLASTSTVNVYGVAPNGFFSPENIASGASPNETYSVPSTGGNIKRQLLQWTDSKPYISYAMRMSGSYTTTVDRLDKLTVKVSVNNSEQ